MNKVRFNGTQYNSPDEMPPAVRAAYERALELAAQGTSSGGPLNIKVSTKVRFIQKGKTYDGLDKMPLDVRAQYDKAMDQMDKDRNCIPDVLEGSALLPAVNQTTQSDSFGAARRSTIQPLAPSEAVITADPPDNRVLLIVASLAVLALLSDVYALLSAFIQH